MSDPTPGRCGALSPSPTGEPPMLCELQAGHAGMHQARQYPRGTIGAGFLSHWGGTGPASLVLTADERALIVDCLRDIPDIDERMAQIRPSRQREIDERRALADRIEASA